MIIAINAARFSDTHANNFIDDYFIRIAPEYPSHQFVFITTTAIADQHLVTAKNITQVISSPKGKNIFMWKFWLNFTLPRLVKKHKATLLINTTGCCSLQTKVPQHLFISDLSYLNFPHFSSRKVMYFFKKNIPVFCKKATTILAPSNFIKQQILKQLLVEEKNIQLFHIPVNEIYRPLSWQEKEIIKTTYTEGTEYFLFSGEINSHNNLINLLKAFTFFKTRQKSNMQLVITSNNVSPNNAFIQSFKTYKFRNEVQLLMDLPERELTAITGAAYAFVYPSLYDGTGMYVLQAMQCEVPVVTCDAGALQEQAGDAALYANEANFEDIANKMMLLFKDESKRAALINKGIQLVADYELKTNNTYWSSIFKTND